MTTMTMILMTVAEMVMIMAMRVLMMMIYLSCKETPSITIPICFGPLPWYLDFNIPLQRLFINPCLFA